MLTYNSSINNEKTHRHIDDNGYLYVDESPILRSGILEYLGSELITEDNEGKVDGVEIDADKIYKIKIPVEELEKAKDTFTLLPLTNDHIWLGQEGADSRDYQEGSSGQISEVKDGMLYVPLKWTSIDTVKQIMNDEKDELSASYENRLIRSEDGDCDFIAVDLRGNHIALVDRGRCGDKVRVLNSALDEPKKELNMKADNETFLVIDGKKIDLSKFFREEQGEGEHSDSITDEGAMSNEDKTCNEDKRALIDEIGGMLKDKVDEELWRTIIGKVEAIAYNPSEDSKADNEDVVLDLTGDDDKDDDDTDSEEKEEKVEVKKEVEKKEDGKVEEKSENEDKAENEDEASKDADVEEKVKAENYEAIYNKAFNMAMKKMNDNEAAKLKAYNAARAVMGDFNAFGMSEKDVYIKALNYLGLDMTGKESVAELASALKAGAGVRQKVDNSFKYESSSVLETKKFNF